MMNYFGCTAHKMSYTDVTLNMMSSYLNKNSNHFLKVFNLDFNRPENHSTVWICVHNIEVREVSMQRWGLHSTHYQFYDFSTVHIQTY